MERSAARGFVAKDDPSGNTLRRHPVTTFFVLALGATWAVWIPRALGAQLGAVGQLWTWTVALVAVLVALVTGGRDAVRELLSRLVRWRVGARWYVVVVVGPALLALLTGGVFVLLGGAWADGNPFASTRIAWALLPMLFAIAALTDGLGEELGWRGFALPRLLWSHTPLTASLVLGAVWATWHLPLLWTTGHVLNRQSLWLFLLDIGAKAILFTWVFLHTRGSVLLAVLLHAGFNVFAVPPGHPTAVGPDLLLIAVALEWVVTVAVVLGSGPVFSRLVRDPELLAQTTGPPGPGATDRPHPAFRRRGARQRDPEVRP